MRIRFRQYIAIQLVPSAWLMKPPVGSGALRSNTPMLSSPRKPPWKMLRPCGVLAVHPPGEVQHQLVEDALEKREVAGIVGSPAGVACDRSGRRARRPRRAPADSRRRTPTRRPAAGRSDACTTRASAARAGPWRTRGRSARAGCSGTPRSHAAYHGYSHLSGIEMMSALLRCGQSGLRPCLRSGGGGGWPGRRSATAARRSRRTACSRSCRRTPAAARGARRREHAGLQLARRTRRPRARGARRRSSKSANGFCGSVRRQAQPHDRPDPPAGDRAV